jgi:DNA-binding GntR family transcriptional regulator
VETILERFPDLAERTYAALQQTILRGDLAPGAELVIVDLAQKLGVSRSPVKHAIARLCGEGLAVQISGNGYYVSRVDDQQLKHLLDARLLIEVAAAERAVVRAEESDLATMRTLVEEMIRCVNPAGGYVNYPDFVERDKKFHGLVVSMSRNPYLVQAHRLLNFHVFQARMHFADEKIGEARAVPAMEEHVAILRAFEGRSAAEAKQAVTTHIRNAIEVFGIKPEV